MHVFRVNETELPAIKKQLQRPVLYVLLALLFILAIKHILTKSTSGLLYELILYSIGLIWGYIDLMKISKEYQTMELTLIPDGIEYRSAKVSYKKIEWSNLIIDEGSDGFVTLKDKTDNKLKRWLIRGKEIIIPPQIMNKAFLLEKLYEQATVN